MRKFGDIILHNQNYYIYLGEKNDNYTYYFGKIIQDRELVRELLTKRDTSRPDPISPTVRNALTIITNFVILTTDDFNEDAAMLARPDSHSVQLETSNLIGSINPSDSEKIKKHIIENNTAFPPPLIRFIKELQEDT